MNLLKRFARACMLLVVCSSFDSQGSPFETWSVRSPLPTRENLTGIVFGNDRFVATSRSWRRLLVSDDGVDWKLGDTAIILHAVFGNGRFVAVQLANSAFFATSLNGVDWKIVARGNQPVSFLGFADNHFIAIGGRTVRTSENGIDWQIRGEHPDLRIKDLTHGNGRFVSVGDGIWISSDAASWSRVGTLISEPLVSITFARDRFVAAGENGGIWTSMDAVDWQQTRKGESKEKFSDVMYDRGYFVAVGQVGISSVVGCCDYAGLVSFSHEGFTWRDSVVSKPLRAVASGHGLFAAVGDDGAILTTASLADWTTATVGTTIDLNGIGHGNDLAVAVGRFGLILSSSNGIDWTRRNSGTRAPLNSVAYGGGRFVAVGVDVMLGSNTGFEWDRFPLGIQNTDVRSVAHGNGRFVAVGAKRHIMPVIFVSQDGAAWQTAAAHPMVGALNAITFGSGKFVAVGRFATADGTMLGSLTSPDGQLWNLHPGEIEATWTGIAYGAGVFAAVGNTPGRGGRIITSRDGANWTEQTIAVSDFQRLESIHFANGHFVAVGEGVVMVSENGRDWQRVLNPEWHLNGVSFGADSFLAVGNDGLILQSLNIRRQPSLSIQRAGNSDVQIVVDLPVALPVTLQVSDDLNSWRPLETIAEPGHARVLDPGSAESQGRFYRAVVGD